MAASSIRTKAGLAKRGVPAPDITRGDVVIEITAPKLVRWYGTRADLTAEGIVPDDAEWREGFDGEEWEDDRYEYELRRCTPAGVGRMLKADKAKIDWWMFAREDKRYRSMGYWPVSIQENREEYARLLRGLEVCMGKRESTWEARYKAECDEQFQALLARALSAEPCPAITQQSLAETKAKRARAVARLRAESRRANGDEAGEAA